MFDDEFNFEEWADLYDSNPNEFERRKDELFKKAIDSAPDEYRVKLKAIQSKLDNIRVKYSNNTTGCATAMYIEMMRGVNDLRKALKGIDVRFDGPKAKVIKLKPKDGLH